MAFQFISRFWMSGYRFSVSGVASLFLGSLVLVLRLTRRFLDPRIFGVGFPSQCSVFLLSGSWIAPPSHSVGSPPQALVLRSKVLEFSFFHSGARFFRPCCNPFLSIFVHFCPFLSIFVLFCPFFVLLCPFLVLVSPVFSGWLNLNFFFFEQWSELLMFSILETATNSSLESVHCCMFS